MHVDGALPLSLAVEKMQALGLLAIRPHAELESHTHKGAMNRCHELVHPDGAACNAHGHVALEFTERGHKRAQDVIRRHRLAERLFVETLHVDSEAEIEQQACKFEHILSPEATDRICSFLGHPQTCPHGSPIPAGKCCVQAQRASAND
jgi:hypothetical protein